MRATVGEGLSLHVDVRGRAGAGAPFVLVHGLASNLRLWDGVAAELADRGHATVAVDLRGHGRSDKPDGGYDIATVGGDLLVLLGHLGWDRPVLVGQSWGANVVLELAWSEPAQVRGIACVDGGWIELADRFGTWEDCAEALSPPRTEGLRLHEVTAMLRGAHPDWPETGIAGTLACFEHRPDGTVRPWLTEARHLAVLRSLWEHRPSTRYAEVQVPVLLVAADGGDAAWVDDKRALVTRAADALPRVRVQWMAGDHDLHAQHPAELAGLLVASVEDGFFS